VSGAPLRQRLAVPAYFAPGPHWAELDAVGPVGLAIVNPASGPGSAASPAYAAQIEQSRARGITIIGYVDTDYAHRPMDDVRRDIDAYARWYGVDGIFLDQVSADGARQRYYAALSAAIKARDAEARVVLNPGTLLPEAFMSVADIVVTCEETYDAYIKRYKTERWMRRYAPERFCHLIHGAPTTKAMQRAIRLSKKRRAGWVYVTPATLPNPWSTLPPVPYWSEELVAIEPLPGDGRLSA
jgi:hypothetical protein